PVTHADDWSKLSVTDPGAAAAVGSVAGAIAEEEDNDRDNGGIRREPGLPNHEAVHPEEPKLAAEFGHLEDEPDDDQVRAKALNRSFRAIARQAALDPGDGLGL